ncbi:NAD(P)H-binding protein [Streptomyces sp. NPDC101455]|uniref:NAD(P)H-binding protein n=1 Tax=Streptomyces sp. NPDC101455 TaxID=3366142 RepID=UPI0038253D4F
MAAADAVDYRALTTADAAERAGVRRFLHISALPGAWRDRGMGPDFEHYMKVKRRADVYLAATGLDWVILRPGALTSHPGTGSVRLGPAIDYGDVPPRRRGRRPAGASASPHRLSPDVPVEPAQS